MRQKFSLFSNILVVESIFLVTVPPPPSLNVVSPLFFILSLDRLYLFSRVCIAVAAWRCSVPCLA